MSDHNPPKRRYITVCQYRSCVRNGSEAVFQALQAAAPKFVLVSKSDCMGQCASGPTVYVMPDKTWYCRVQRCHVDAIVQQHLWNNCPVERLLHPRFHPRSYTNDNSSLSSFPQQHCTNESELGHK
jgi:(2Fe-2S) ferredoxin